MKTGPYQPCKFSAVWCSAKPTGQKGKKKWHRCWQWIFVPNWNVIFLNGQRLSMEQLTCSAQHRYQTSFRSLMPQMLPRIRLGHASKRCRMNQRLSLKHVAPQPLHSHLTERWPFSGGCRPLSDTGSRAQTGCRQLCLAQAASGDATWAEVDSSEQGVHGTPWCPGKGLWASEGKAGTEK